MRDFITVVCFVLILTVLGLAERFYLKWKLYVACSQVNLMLAEGRLERTLEFIKSREDVLQVDTIDDAVDICQDSEV